VGPVREKQVMTMYSNYSQFFSNAVNKVAAGGGTSVGNSGGGFFGSKPSTTTVKDATGTGVLGFLSGIFNSEKRVDVQPHGSDRASVTVKDYTGASAAQVLTGNVPEQRYNATKVGNNVVVEQTANSGSGFWSQILGTPGK
jgi:hypothetical protein